MASSKRQKAIIGGLVAASVGVVALLFATGASAEEFVPEEEDEPIEEDPEAKEEIPEQKEVEEIEEKTGVDLGEEGWTPAKISDFLGSLGYKGSGGSRLRQFQRDSRVPALKGLLLSMPQVATDLNAGFSKVDGQAGPKTIEQLNRAGLLAVTLKWRRNFVGAGGSPAFFQSLQNMGYTVTRTPEVATKAFQQDAKVAIPMPSLRTDGNVDGPTLNALAIALTHHAQGNWVFN